MNSKIKRIFTVSLTLLLAVILACGAAAYTNLAKNGDASLGYYEDEDENGYKVPKDWGYWLQDNGKDSYFEIAEGAGPDGSDCFHLYSKNIAHATLINFAGCEAGKTYTVTAYVKYADLEGGAVVIECYTPEGSPLPTDLSRERGNDTNSNFGGKLDGDSDWRCIWYTFTIPEGADAAKTKVQMRIWDGAGDLWFDNFTVTEGDKPAFTEMPDNFTPSTSTEPPATEPPATEPKDTEPVSSSNESTKTPEISGNNGSTETPSTGTADNKPADDNKKGGISPAVIVVICVVAAAVIAGIVVAVVKKKKK